MAGREMTSLQALAPAILLLAATLQSVAAAPMYGLRDAYSYDNSASTPFELRPHSQHRHNASATFAGLFGLGLGSNPRGTLFGPRMRKDPSPSPVPAAAPSFHRPGIGDGAPHYDPYAPYHAYPRRHRPCNRRWGTYYHAGSDRGVGCEPPSVATYPHPPAAPQQRLSPQPHAGPLPLPLPQPQPQPQLPVELSDASKSHPRHDSSGAHGDDGKGLPTASHPRHSDVFTSYVGYYHAAAGPSGGLIWGVQCKGLGCRRKAAFTGFREDGGAYLQGYGTAHTGSTAAAVSYSGGGGGDDDGVRVVRCPWGSFASALRCDDAICKDMSLTCSPLGDGLRAVFKERGEGVWDADNVRVYCREGQYVDGVSCAGPCTTGFEILCTAVRTLESRHFWDGY